MLSLIQSLIILPAAFITLCIFAVVVGCTVERKVGEK